MYYMEKKQQNKQVLQVFFGITGKYNPVYQNSKGNVMRTIAKVHDLVPFVLIPFYTCRLSEVTRVQTLQLKLDSVLT